MHKHRIIVAGGRKFDNFWLAHDTLDNLTQNLDKNDIMIISGCAIGADKPGEIWAEELGVEVMRFPADWHIHGKSAGHVRNREMAEYATHLVAFWDGKSRGTQDMILVAQEHNLKVRVIRYE